MELFGNCVGIVAVAVVVVFLITRAIDYYFTRKEAKYQSDLDTSREERMQWVGYQVNKNLINHGCKRVKRMSIEVSRQINQALWDQIKK